MNRASEARFLYNKSGGARRDSSPSLLHHSAVCEGPRRGGPHWRSGLTRPTSNRKIVGSTPTWGTPSPLLFFFPRRARTRRGRARHAPAPLGADAPEMPSRFPDISGASPAQARNFSFFFFFFFCQRGGEGRVLLLALSLCSREERAGEASAPAAAQDVRAWTGARVALLLHCSGPGSPLCEGLGAPAAPRRGASRRGGWRREPPLPPAPPRALRTASPDAAGSGKRRPLSRLGRIRERSGRGREGWPWPRPWARPWATGTQVSRRPREPRGAAAPAAAWARAAAAARIAPRRAHRGGRAPAPAGARPHQTMPQKPNDA